MTVEYTKTSSEEAYKNLDQMIVEGFKLRDRLINENNSADENPSSEMIKSWRDAYRTWYNNCATRLLNIYQSERESLTFQHESGLEYYVSGRHPECNTLITKIDVRIKLLRENIKLLTSRFPIIFRAGRDNNVQLGGISNKQEINNEGQ